VFVQYDGEDVIQARRQVSSQWLFLRERGLGHAARRQQGFGGGQSELCMFTSVCPLQHCGLAGWDRPSGWRACHGPVSAAVAGHCGGGGLMRSSSRVTNGCWENGSGKRRG